eukprot:gene8414-239_t
MIKAIAGPRSNFQRKTTKPKRIYKIPQRKMICSVAIDDLCVINIPHEMLIVGNLSPHVDGHFAKVISVHQEDAVVEMVQGGEKLIIPLFCLTKKTDVFNKRSTKKGQSIDTR